MSKQVGTKSGRGEATARTKELRALLEGRRRRLMADVHGGIKDVRSRERDSRDVADAEEAVHGDSQEDVHLALIQMKAETLGRIERALRRLDQGAYGNCVECEGPISKERLSALPFASRCIECERAREDAARATRSPEASRAYPSSSVDLA